MARDREHKQKWIDEFVAAWFITRDIGLSKEIASTFVPKEGGSDLPDDGGAA